MAKHNSLTYTRLRDLLHYDPDLGWFMRLQNVGQRPDHKAGAIPGSLSARDGYVTLTIDGTKYQSHQVAWFYMTGTWPKHEVDHIDTLRSHNNFFNLRPADDFVQAQNRIRARKDSTTGVQGVGRHWNKFRAYIRHNGKRRHLGLFDTEALAHAAYVDAKRASHPGNTL